MPPPIKLIQSNIWNWCLKKGVPYTEGDANARVTCDRFEKLSLTDTMKLQERINNQMITTFSLNHDRLHVLIDLPVEYDSMKLGEDLNIETFRGEVVALSKLSGIVEGAQKGFVEHIQRLRVFVHPETYERLAGRRKHLEGQIQEMLVSLV